MCVLSKRCGRDFISMVIEWNHARLIIPVIIIALSDLINRVTCSIQHKLNAEEKKDIKREVTA